MKVWDDISQFPKKGNAVVTAGTFDGVHTGHRRILSRLKECAREAAGETVLLTFHPHPRTVLFPDDNDLRLLSTPGERKELLEDIGLDHLIIIPFTKAFSRTSSLEFVRNVLVKRIGTKKLVIGFNHHFGRNREGTFEHLREFGPLYGFQVEEIPAFDVENVEVSSTKIRFALLSGDIATATTYLGYPYFLSGHVVRGEQEGRKLGFPTANLHISDQFKLIPANGVYEVTSVLDKKAYRGMMNIGYRPTMGGNELRLEVHLLDFDGDLYGKTLKIAFLRRLRDEIKFSGPEALKAQLLKDKKVILQG
ncbi:MAG: bifunctional riboflavin kinase/FAD synthetase [Bacteroidia bacterium]|nr:bifunctional riboflavin kinase/FAD synthetase [Bacteroidia bacterium]